MKKASITRGGHGRIGEDEAGHPDLSVVVPILDERDSVVELYERLTAVLAPLAMSYEIVFVDDGSTDGSVRVCRELCALDRRVVLVELRRNFGKATALQAGFHLARGGLLITMDGDLQDQPEDIPAFLAALRDDVDLVCGWKRDRQDPLAKTLPSRIFNLATSRLTGVRLRDVNCGFKGYRREVVDSLDVYGDLYRFIPVLAHAKGYRIREVPIHHCARRHGSSKYGKGRFLRGALDLLTVLFLCGYGRRPLHFFGSIGFGLLLSGFGIDTYLVIQWALGLTYLSNRPLLMFGTALIILGVEILIFGLLAEMVNAASYRRKDVGALVRRVHDGRRAAARQPASLSVSG
jgi:glycosyltransferase involved in cell wall biosynthesis